MIHYLDSSAIVKNYIDEPGSEWMRKMFKNSQRGAIFICEIAGAEVFAAFHIRFRAGDISQQAL
jgi:predicted nucleic acid-binding protein